MNYVHVYYNFIVILYMYVIHIIQSILGFIYANFNQTRLNFDLFLYCIIVISFFRMFTTLMGWVILLIPEHYASL